MLCALAAGALLLPACGGGGTTSTTPSATPAPAPTPTPPPSTTPAPSGGTTVTITSAGASPTELTVSPGARVTFVNNDTRPHDMSSDPHPFHTDCPEINEVGFLNAGQSKQTGNLNAVKTCGFHDHDQPSNASLQGRITIQ